MKTLWDQIVDSLYSGEEVYLVLAGSLDERKVIHGRWPNQSRPIQHELVAIVTDKRHA